MDFGGDLASQLPPDVLVNLANLCQNLDQVPPTIQLGLLWDDVAVVAADLWDEEPKILSGSPGFDGIIGLDVDYEGSLEGGATWVNDLEALCGPSATSPQTSAVPFSIGNIYNCGEAVDGDDGYPICFSWPVLPSSIDREYFRYKRSDGAEITPKCISTIPNFEYNERHCVVLFDDFFTRKFPDEEGYYNIEEVEVVGPIMLVGPGGLFDATGMMFRPSSPNATAYLSGPVFVGARLVPLHEDGEGLAEDIFNLLGDGAFPNSGLDLYGDVPVEELYRLRLYYSGGMTPDGLTGLTPVMFDRYFTLIFNTGQELSTSNSETIIEGTTTTVSVLGLADVGVSDPGNYTPCYADDRDNYIDIILHAQGEPTDLQTLEAFRAFSQQPGLYNPGGPGPTPFEGVRYTAPAEEQTFPIDVDLSRLREVTYCVHANGTSTMDVSACQDWLSQGEIMQFELGQVFKEQLQMICFALGGAPGGGPGGDVNDTSSSASPSRSPISDGDGGEPTAAPSMGGETDSPSLPSTGVSASLNTFLCSLFCLLSLLF